MGMRLRHCREIRYMMTKKSNAVKVICLYFGLLYKWCLQTQHCHCCLVSLFFFEHALMCGISDYHKFITQATSAASAELQLEVLLLCSSKCLPLKTPRDPRAESATILQRWKQMKIYTVPEVIVKSKHPKNGYVKMLLYWHLGDGTVQFFKWQICKYYCSAMFLFICWQLCLK